MSVKDTMVLIYPQNMKHMLTIWKCSKGNLFHLQFIWFLP